MLRTGLVLVAGLAAAVLPTTAPSAEETLKTIMQELRSNFVEVSDGFLLGDFQKVADAALAIAEHPRIPPEQVDIVANELGADMAVFRNFDVQVHEWSLEMYKAANKPDRNAAVQAYHGMVAACFACHAAFRQRVADALLRVEQ